MATGGVVKIPHVIARMMPALLLGISLVDIAPAHGANVLSPAVPVSQVLTVQPIIICDNAGLNCAPNSGLAAYETMANTIFDQSGIGVAFAPPRFYNNANFLTPHVDTTTSGLFDTAHDLLRLPGHGQSTNPNTLNVFLVDNIVSTTNGVVNTSVHSYGYGLIGGNGVIIATAPDSLGKVAATDTMAHELGHNLGLAHSDSPLQPYNSNFNLMNTASRVVATDPCQITPYTCAGAPTSARDVLAAPQLTTLAAPPILTSLPRVQDTNVDIGPPLSLPPGQVAEQQYNYTPPPPPPPTLLGVKWRFTNPATVPDSCFSFPVPAGGCGYAGLTSNAIGGGHVEWVYNIAGLHLSPAALFSVAFCCASGAYSTEFDFSNGVTSRAGFDFDRGGALGGRRRLWLRSDGAGRAHRVFLSPDGCWSNQSADRPADHLRYRHRIGDAGCAGRHSGSVRRTRRDGSGAGTRRRGIARNGDRVLGDCAPATG